VFEEEYPYRVECEIVEYLIWEMSHKIQSQYEDKIFEKVFSKV